MVARTRCGWKYVSFKRGTSVFARLHERTIGRPFPINLRWKRLFRIRVVAYLAMRMPTSCASCSSLNALSRSITRFDWKGLYIRMTCGWLISSLCKVIPSRRARHERRRPSVLGVRVRGKVHGSQCNDKSLHEEKEKGPPFKDNLPEASINKNSNVL